MLAESALHFGYLTGEAESQQVKKRFRFRTRNGGRPESAAQFVSHGETPQTPQLTVLVPRPTFSPIQSGIDRRHVEVYDGKGSPRLGVALGRAERFSS